MNYNIYNIDIQKNSNNFSFIQEFFDKIINNDFIQNSYKNFSIYDLSSLGENTTYESNIYNVISAIGEDVTKEIYTEILNYIDNISDVDFCKIQALASISKLLGIDYEIFQNIDKIPINILKIMDIMSINPIYMVSSDILSESMRTYISDNIISNITEYTTEHNNEYNIVYKNKLTPIISTLIYNDISNVLYATYPFNNTKYIYSELSTNILLSSFELPINQYDKENILKLKSKLNIPSSFDQIKEADNVFFGKTNILNYSQTEQRIINYELNRRNQLYDINNPKSRYKYYIENNFKQYFQFIEFEYSKSLLQQTDIYKQYDVDNDYIIISNDNISLQPQLLSADENKNSSILNQEIIKNVVNKLTLITCKICNIREKIKSYAQKLFMKGTYTFLEHILKDYICQLSQIENLSINYSDIDINFVEYDDITQYNNIRTDISSDLSDNFLNVQYWNQPSYKIIKPNDSNNLFSTNDAFLTNVNVIQEADVNIFYTNILKTKFNYGKLSQFLQYIYESGAEKMYISKNENNETVINYTDLSGQLNQLALDKKLSNEFDEYKRQLFLKYIGQFEGYFPYQYIDNIKHPSFQLHPYIKNFIKHSSNNYPVKNITKFLNTDIDNIKYDVNKNIKKYVDNDGYIISAWNIYTNTNDDYLSKYELKTNVNKLDIIDPVVGYPGLFYPDAILDFLTDSNKFFTELNKNKWYKGLNLSYNEYRSIEQKLKSNEFLLRKIASSNDNFDIYKYGEDIYGTQYILLKQYDLNISDIEKHDTPGLLMIKPKNWPISLPAFVFDIYFNNKIDKNKSFISYDTIEKNAEFENISSYYYNDTYFPGIYDFELSENQQNIMFLAKTCSNNYIDIITIPRIKYNDKQITKYYLEYPIFIDNYYNNDSSGKQSLSVETGYRHVKYINIDKHLMSIYIKTNNTSVYFFENIFSNNTYNYQSVINNIELKYNISDDVVFDITNTGKAVLAFCIDNYTNTSYKNYLGEELDYTEISNFYDIFSKSIVTYDFIITPNNFISTDNYNIYNTHTQMGFIPVIIGNDKFNQINETKLSSEQQVYKIQLFGLSSGEISNGIDFNFTAPLRIFEKPSTHIPTNFDDRLSCFETLNFDFENNNYKPFKLDGGYIEDKYVKQNKYVKSFELSPEKYVTTENIALANKHLTFNNIGIFSVIPDTLLQTSQLLNNRYNILSYENILFQENEEIIEISCYKNEITCDMNKISVQWYKNPNDNQIKLDFNAIYALSANIIDNSINNYRNTKHLFLNLDKPGDAGYLNIYSTNEYYVEQIQCYYIKNISDKYPKFILSAVINGIDVGNNLNMLNTTNGIITLYTDNNILEYIEV